MNRDDIVNAARDVRMPKKSDLPDIDLSKIELPKQISDRLPNRKRTNPILPIAGFVAIGAVIAAAWWLITSPVTGPRIRHAVNDLKARMNGESNDLVRYDDEKDLGSLLADSPTTEPLAMTADPYHDVERHDRPRRRRPGRARRDARRRSLPLSTPISLTYAAPAPAGAASSCAHVDAGVRAGR